MQRAPELSVDHPGLQRRSGPAGALRAPLPGARRAAPPLRDRVHQRRQPRPLRRAAARAVPAAPRRDPRDPVQRQLRPAHGDHGRASSTAAGGASSRWTPTCRTRRRRSATCSPRWTKATTTSAPSAASARTARFRRYASRADEPGARAHHAHPHDRPGLHAARLQPRRSSTRSTAAARSTPSSRRSPTPSPRNPTEIEVAHEERARRRIEVFALQADPAQLRPGDRVLARAAADVFAGRHRAVAASGRVRRLPRDPTPCRGPEAEGLFTLFAIAFLLIGVALFGIGLLGEYVGRIYQQVRERPRYLSRRFWKPATAPKRAMHGRARVARSEPPRAPADAPHPR